QGGRRTHRGKDAPRRRGAGHPDGYAGERAAELLGGPDGPDPHRAERGRRALGTPPVPGEAAAPPALRGAALPREVERSVAVGAPCESPAPAAGDAGDVPGPRHLDEDRAACQTVP